MIRANLLPRTPRSFAALGLELGGDYLRQSLLGVAVIVSVTAAGIGIETLRVHRIESTFAEASEAVANRAQERDESATLALRVARYQEIAREAEGDRQSGNAAALAIARIGNAIPPGVWLDSIAHDASGFTVTGSAESLDSIGTVIAALGAASPGRRAALVNIDNRDRSIHFSARIPEPDSEAAR